MYRSLPHPIAIVGDTERQRFSALMKLRLYSIVARDLDIRGKFDLITCMLWTLPRFEGTVHELMRTAYSGIESDGHTAQ